MDNEAHKVTEAKAPWGSFLFYTIYSMVFPLMPLVVEYFWNLWIRSKGDIKPENICLAGAIYAIALACSSRWKWFFAVATGVSLFVTAFYGIAVGLELSASSNAQSTNTSTNGDPAEQLKLLIYAATGVLAAAHLIERFIRHIIEKEEFPDFSKKQVSDG